MKTVKVGNIAKIFNGYAFKSPEYSDDPDGGFQVIRITNVQNGYISNDNQKFIKLSNKALERFVLAEGDILVSLTGNVGRFGRIKKENLPAVLNQRVGKVIIKSKEVFPDYLFHILNSNVVESELLGKGKGIAQKNIGSLDIENIEIPLPPLEDKKRIVKILDQADALRQKRKQAIELLDNYLKSVFWKMFENSINDSATYQTIGKTTDFIDYRGKTPKKSDSGIPLITAKHVKKGFFSFDPKEYITEEKYNEIMTRGFPRPNDVLFTTEGATLGNVCRIPLHIDKFGVGQRLITLQCKDCLTSEYLHFILLNVKIRLEIFKQATGSAAQGIRSAIFYKIKIPIPPKKLQERFSVIVQKTESLKQKMLAQSAEMENQFQTLMQKAFKSSL